MSSDGAPPVDLPRLGSAFGHYRLDALVGRGGMGVVFRATDLTLERTVALKFLSPELAADEAFRDRFVRESRLAASIEHPAIVPVYEAGAIGGTLFIAMRFVPGRDLGTVLRLEAPLDLVRTLGMARRLADALDAAHRRGLVHRDVKPGNVLVEQVDEELVYLADFGLTRRLGESTAARPSGPVGTLDYVAPEQIERARVDGHADQYALACLLFHCLTGSPPFEADSDAGVLYAHLHADRPRPSEREPDLPTRIDGPILRALSRDPGERFPDCRSFVTALAGEAAVPAAAVSGPPVERPSGAPARPPRSRRPAITVLGVASVMILGAALAAPAILSPDDAGPGSTGPAGDPSVRGAAGELGLREDEIILFASDVDGDYDLYALVGEQAEPRRLTRTSRQERSPAISPDGTTIAYVVGTEPRRDIWLMDAEGSRARRLTADPADDTDPAWSPDGSLAFASRRSDPLFDIFEIRDHGSGLDERNARNLTSRPAVEHFPDWAPSGRRLAIASNHFGRNRSIVLIDADVPGLLQLLTATSAFDFHPSWAPDGRSLAFYRRDFCRTCPAQRGTADLVLTDSRGGGLRRLTSTSGRDEIEPDWAPDGRALVYSAGSAGAMELFLMTTDERRRRQITRRWADAVEPSWGARAARDAPSVTPDPSPR